MRTRDRYTASRRNARAREVPFKLSFEEWLKIWMDSGHFNECGRKGNQYVMARYGDKGAYEVGNVRICTGAENRAEMWNNPETKARIIGSKVGNTYRLGRGHTRKARARMSRSHKGKVLSEKTCTKMSVSKVGNKNSLGFKHSERTKVRMGKAQERRQTRIRKAKRGANPE